MTTIEQKRVNFLRIAILVVDHSKAALISLIELDLQNKHLTFEQFLNENQHEIYHLCNNGRCCRCLPGSSLLPRNRIMFQSQLEFLFDKAAKMPGHRGGLDFCCSLAIKGIGTDVLDLTLAKLLLVNCCTDVFWYSCLQFQDLSFEDFLKRNKHMIYHLWQYNQRCCHCRNDFQLPVNCERVNSQQWHSMFVVSSGLPKCRKRSYNGEPNCICSISPISSINQCNLDPILQQKILQIFCSSRKSMDVLVRLKNSAYSHTTGARMNDSDYTASIHDIGKAILDIAKVCGKEPEFKTVLNDVKYGRLDNTLIGQYQSSLLEIERVRNLFTTADEGLVKMLQETTEKNLVKSSKKTEEHTAANIQIIDESIQCTSDGLQKVETEKRN